MIDAEFPDKQAEGAESLKEELLLRFDKCEAAYEKWNEEAEEDYRFALGQQWDEDDKKKLDDQGRPALTFNRIKPLLNVIAGYQRENSARIKVMPEGGEDKIFSEVNDKALKYIDKQGKLNYKLGYLFDDGLYCGKGFLEAVTDFTQDPILGELKFILNGPYSIMVDPDCIEYDINAGAEYLFKVQRYTRTKLKAMFPKKAKLIDEFVKDQDQGNEEATGHEGDADNYGLDKNKATVVKEDELGDEEEPEGDVKFTLKEYWYKKYVTKFFVVDPETKNPRRFDTKDEAAAFARKASGVMAQEPVDAGGEGEKEEDADIVSGLKIIERTTVEMHVASLACGRILQDALSPYEPRYSGFPFFRFIADWAPSAKNELLKVQGITRSLKDAQREKNKSKSQFLHIINTQANSGWVGDEDALSPTDWTRLEDFGAQAGVVIRKKKGSELTKIEPSGVPMQHLQREQEADNEFKQISNINPDLLGFMEKTASGRAIALRIKQAILALVRIFSNYKYTKELIGRFIMQIMPDLFDARKLAKVLGSQYLKSVKTEQYPNGLDEGALSAFLQMVEDNKYDVQVAEADQGSTTRYEVLENLLELAKARYPIPIELLIEYMDIPNSEDVKQKIQAEQQRQMAMMQQAQGQGQPAT